MHLAHAYFFMWN
uniref:Uncharacterized protein n=1 Tax=Anguilla anguilla TaxID=7936 RepID=A0A0E9SMG3_ANGAN